MVDRGPLNKGNLQAHSSFCISEKNNKVLIIALIPSNLVDTSNINNSRPLSVILQGSTTPASSVVPIVTPTTMKGSLFKKKKTQQHDLFSSLSKDLALVIDNKSSIFTINRVYI